MVPNDPSSQVTEKDLLDYDFQAWQKSIDVQQHFNNLEMQVRNFAITVLAGVIGAAAVVYKESLTSSKLILWVGLLVWIAFFLMDFYWYHRLLHGSVKHAQSIEDRLEARIPGITLSRTIGNYSPINFLGLKIHTKGKMVIFYGLIAAAIGVAIYRL